VGLTAIACEFGDRERAVESIDGLDALAESRGLKASLTAMGCRTFWQLTRPVESYVIASLARTLATSGVPGHAVDHLILATSDWNLRHLEADFARTVLTGVGLTRCLPMFVSMQQCASSVAGLAHARSLFLRPEVANVLVAAFDFVVDDQARVQSFALFGDAAASCLLTRDDAAPLSVRGCATDVDFAGLEGRDTFDSRKRIAVATMANVLEGARRIEDVEKCFSTNLYKPIAMFNAGVTGIRRQQMSLDTLAVRAHCGNCDWMINLAHHQDSVGLLPGRSYLAQAFAPGFFGCGLLESRPKASA
jgi:hypothetical protein